MYYRNAFLVCSPRSFSSSFSLLLPLEPLPPIARPCVCTATFILSHGRLGKRHPLVALVRMHVEDHPLRRPGKAHGP